MYNFILKLIAPTYPNTAVDADDFLWCSVAEWADGMNYGVIAVNGHSGQGQTGRLHRHLQFIS